jgi:MoxR-like ATPase/Mg-chelatase subunit ChlD
MRRGGILKKLDQIAEAMPGLTGEIIAIQERYKIIGREEELTKALAAVRSNKHLLVEGVAGVGKTVMTLALARYFNRSFFRIDGDERYTEQKLAGWFDPALAVAKGYSWETFIPGPLSQAMTEGSFLFINELNRLPEGTQNVLLPAMDEGQIVIPKIGTIISKPGFLIVATQNPEEFVGTSRLSEALQDRFVWLRLDYQSETEEREIVKKETGNNDYRTIAIAVRIARKTREDSEIRHGASVRAAIDITQLIQRLTESVTLSSDVWVKVATMALATKVQLQDRTTVKMEKIIANIVTSVLSEYAKGTGDQGPDTLMQATENGKDERPDTVRRMKGALQAKDLAEIVRLSQENPRSLSELLLEEDLLDRILEVAERSDLKWPALQLLFMSQSNLDPEQRQRAKTVLNRTIRRIAAKIAGNSIRSADYVKVPFQPGLEELDLEETIENFLGKGSLDYGNIVCVEKRARKKAFSLILDVSNSMQAERILIAAIAVGVFAYKFLDDHYSIITFSDRAHLLKPIEENPDVVKLIDKMLDLQPGGSTNIEEALRKGLDELERSLWLDGTGVLITDGWVTRGGDPVEVAEKYPKLHVIQVLLGTGGGDSDMCVKLAIAGRGRYSYVRDFFQLPQAIMRIMM